MQTTHISCPNCGWEPDESSRWNCSVCDTLWNTFETDATCPTCGKVYEDTGCPNCHQTTLNKDWYTTDTGIETPQPAKTNWFSEKNRPYPVTDDDKTWIEEALGALSEIVEPTYFKSLVTVIPDKQYFDRRFDGSERDAIFVFERLVSIMNIDSWEIQLMFFSEKAIPLRGGITPTLSDNLKGSWKSSSTKYVDNGLGQKEIWIELETLKDTESLISVIAHELAKYKLESEYQFKDVDVLFISLTALAFGFGIFMGNSYFRYSQWQGTSHHGWRMRKSGYLPEQVIAYAMACLALYRDENISWKRYLNKTMLRYFEQSYTYIEQTGIG